MGVTNGRSCQTLSLCLVFPLLSCPYLVFPFPVLVISLLVPSPVLLIIYLILCSFFVINNFYFYFFHTQHNRISKIKQNKTADTYSTSQGSIKREGEREGQQEHKSHSFK